MTIKSDQKQNKTSQFKLFIVPLLIKIIMHVIVFTCRVRWHNKEQYSAIATSEKPYVLSMWHNCCTIAAWAMRNSNITVMISDSKDGEYVSRLANSFGIQTIRGSSSSGSEKAIRAALRLLARKKPIAITPDGPRGPRYKMKSGALWFAASSKSPILPLHIEASRQWVFNSWDKHTFPKPFSTIHIHVGEPVYLQREDLEDNIDKVAKHVEVQMMKNVDNLKKIINHR